MSQVLRFTNAPHLVSLLLLAASFVLLACPMRAEARAAEPRRSAHFDLTTGFGRLFPAEDRGGLPALVLPPRRLEALARLMVEAPDGERRPPSAIPAGYTFLGQFIDHDLTLDTTSRIDRAFEGLVRNERTPELDLDNVYGGGPEVSPHLYNLPYLRVGKPLARHRFDLLRVASGNHPGPRGGRLTALIGDPRDDENLIISQLHAAFVACHNAAASRIVEEKFGHFRRRLCPGREFCPPAVLGERLSAGERREVFETARDHTIHYYHRVIAEDYLPRIIGQERTIDLFRNGRDFYFPNGFRRRDGLVERPFIPVEFAVAAFRFGHTQVNPSYRLNSTARRNLFASAQERVRGKGLRSAQPVSPENLLDWRFFFPLERTPPREFNWSRPLDRLVTQSLHELHRVGAVPDGELGSLPARNMIRANAFLLPSGEDIATEILPVLERRGVLRHWDEAFRGPRKGWQFYVLPPPPDVRTLIGEGRMPLWYYVLYEAEIFGLPSRYPGAARARDGRLRLSAYGDVTGGETLGPVGGTIVGEVLTGLLEQYRAATGKGLDYETGARTHGQRAHRPYTMGDFLIAAGVAD
jgi:hypothetical protein